MNTLTKTAIILLSFFAFGCIAQTYTWKDDRGKTHYGDNVPPEYKDSAKLIELQPLNTVAPEEHVRQLNKTAVNRLRREDAQNKQSKIIASETNTIQTEPAAPQITREQCRDQPYLTVKQRTECFRAAADAEK